MQYCSALELTGRMKDFYDIYYLSRTFDFDGMQNCNPLYLKHCSDVKLPMIKIVLSVLLRLPMMKICKSVGNIFLRTIKDDTLEFLICHYRN